jgi:hypothetical protein
MQEVVPGVRHWTAFHEGIRSEVSSYYVEPARALIDPMLPPDGTEAFEGEAPPERILLTNRHHYRHSDRFREAFDCPVLCHESGLHEFEGGPDVQGFSFGDELAPGIVALEVGVLCPEESALHIQSAGAVAVADGVVHYGGRLGFVPDGYLGEDPEAIKRGLRKSYRRIAQAEWDALLLAHGDPLASGGRAALREFAEGS